MKHVPVYWRRAKRILSKRDPVLRKIIKKHKRGFLTTRNDPFFSLCRTIVGQQISIKAADSSSGSYAPSADNVPATEVPEQELYHAKSFWTKWVFCQDAKVIGVQYALTATAVGLIGLVLSWGMRLQLGFPETFSFLGPATYYQSVTMHGMIMVVYLLTALFLGGFGNYLIPLMVGARDMVFPYVNMVSFWMFLVAVFLFFFFFMAFFFYDPFFPKNMIFF